MEIKYLKYFDLTEPPYSYLHINPRFFYNAQQYRYAKAILNSEIVTKSAHLYLTGPVGSGKTMLMRVLETDLKSYDSNAVYYNLAIKNLTGNSFLRRLCGEMDIKTERSYVQTLDNFENKIGEWSKQNITPILLIDDAHKLSSATFDVIHHIMNFVTQTRLLIVVVLSGQEELAPKIRKKPEIRSRMHALSISSLSNEDVVEMVNWRWKVASEKKHNPLPFDAEALDEIYYRTRGLPRDICSLCQRSLEYAFAEKKKEINLDLVKVAAESLHFEEVE